MGLGYRGKEIREKDLEQEVGLVGVHRPPPIVKSIIDSKSLTISLLVRETDEHACCKERAPTWWVDGLPCVVCVR